MKVKTFAELEATKEVTARELLATLKDYAECGAAIKGRVVVAIINRTPLGRYDLTDLLMSAAIGVQTHNLMQEPREVAEYQEVVDRMRYIISRTDMNFIRVLRSGFKPGKFKNVVFLWVGLCLVAMAIGKLTDNTLLLWIAPVAITAFLALILTLVYSAVKKKPVA